MKKIALIHGCNKNVGDFLISQHSFIVYIDRNFIVRDSFISDFKIESKNENVFELDKTLTKFNGSPYAHIGNWPYVRGGEKVEFTKRSFGSFLDDKMFREELYKALDEHYIIKSTDDIKLETDKK